MEERIIKYFEHLDIDNDKRKMYLSFIRYNINIIIKYLEVQNSQTIGYFVRKNISSDKEFIFFDIIEYLKGIDGIISDVKISEIRSSTVEFLKQDIIDDICSERLDENEFKKYKKYLDHDDLIGYKGISYSKLKLFYMDYSNKFNKDKCIKDSKYALAFGYCSLEDRVRYITTYSDQIINNFKKLLNTNVNLWEYFIELPYGEYNDICNLFELLKNINDGKVIDEFKSRYLSDRNISIDKINFILDIKPNIDNEKELYLRIRAKDKKNDERESKKDSKKNEVRFNNAETMYKKVYLNFDKYKYLLEDFINSEYTKLNAYLYDKGLSRILFSQVVNVSKIFDVDLYNRYLLKHKEEPLYDTNYIDNLRNIINRICHGVMDNGTLRQFNYLDYKMISPFEIGRFSNVFNIFEGEISDRNKEKISEFIKKYSSGKRYGKDEYFRLKLTFNINGRSITATLEDKKKVYDFIKNRGWSLEYYLIIPILKDIIIKRIEDEKILEKK